MGQAWGGVHTYFCCRMKSLSVIRAGCGPVRWSITFLLLYTMSLHRQISTQPSKMSNSIWVICQTRTIAHIVMTNEPWKANRHSTNAMKIYCLAQEMQNCELCWNIMDILTSRSYKLICNWLVIVLLIVMCWAFLNKLYYKNKTKKCIQFAFWMLLLQVLRTKFNHSYAVKMKLFWSLLLILGLFSKWFTIIVPYPDNFVWETQRYL